METRILIVSLLSIIALSGCGKSGGGDMPLPDGWTSPSGGSGSNPSDDGGANSGGSSSSSSSAIATKSGVKYTTNRGTNFYAYKHQTLLTASGEYFKGATGYGGNLYMLTIKYLNGGTNIWRIYQVNPSSLASIVQCSWYESNYVMGGLTTDGIYFYIFGVGYTNNVIRVSVNGCVKASDTYFPTTPYFSVIPTFSIDSGNFYFPGTASNGFPYSYSLIKVPANKANYVVDVPETLTADYSTNWVSTKALTVKNGIRWGVFSEDFSNYTIWRFDTNGSATAGTIPSKVLDYYIYPSQAAFLSDTTFVLISYSYQVDIIYFDMSEF